MAFKEKLKVFTIGALVGLIITVTLGATPESPPCKAPPATPADR